MSRMGFRQLVPEHPFWIGNFDFLLQGVRGNRALTERALAELRHCLTLVSDDLARSEAEDLIKRLVVSDRRVLIDRPTQRRVADVLRERLAL